MFCGSILIITSRKAKSAPKLGEPYPKKAIVEAILDKHDAATGNRKFNSILATASINDAIEYYDLFKTLQTARQNADPAFIPLNIACVFSPPADDNADVEADSRGFTTGKSGQSARAGEKRKLRFVLSLTTTIGFMVPILAFGNLIFIIRMCRSELKIINIPMRIYARPRLGGENEHKIDIIVVVDMLLTGFDSKYLNTLYVDKKLKYHGLIQAFSRTNRVLNGTKPYGNILDFRHQRKRC